MGHCLETSPSLTNRGHGGGTAYSTRIEHIDAAEGGKVERHAPVEKA